MKFNLNVFRKKKIQSTNTILETDINSKSDSIAINDQKLKPKVKELRTVKYYNLNSLKDDRTWTQKARACQGFIAKKTQPLKTKSFYSNLLFSKVPIIKTIINYKLKSYLFPDIISGMIGD